MVADIYSTTFDQEKSGPFNSILKVLGIIPGYSNVVFWKTYSKMIVINTRTREEQSQPQNLVKNKNTQPELKITGQGGHSNLKLNFHDYSMTFYRISMTNVQPV